MSFEDGCLPINRAGAMLPKETIVLLTGIIRLNNIKGLTWNRPVTASHPIPVIHLWLVFLIVNRDWPIPVCSGARGARRGNSHRVWRSGSVVVQHGGKLVDGISPQEDYNNTAKPGSSDRRQIPVTLLL